MAAIPPRLFPATPARPRAVSTRLDALVPWVVAALATTGLYFGRSVLVSIMLSVLLSFLLAPLVALLRRARLGRSLSVWLAVLLALGIIGGTGAVIAGQAAVVAQDAPAYAERIAARVERTEKLVRDRFAALNLESRASVARAQGRAAAAATRSRSDAVPVAVQEPPPTAWQEFRTLVLPALAPLETMVIVIVVTIFILFQADDLKDRLIRLMGVRDLHRTTLALDDTARRLSRYFLSLLAVNCSFGAVVWGGLWLMGVPAAGLWGILAGLLRFVPYIGAVIGAIGPLLLALAVDPGWGLALQVAALFLLVEPLVGYVLEPLLYGRSTGLSPVSVLVAALFWTWIWGPVGLVLSMPMTLTLVVLGRHLPALHVLDVALGDQPALTPAETFYQRALAGRTDDAVHEAVTQLGDGAFEAWLDNVALPGLRLAAADADRGALGRSQQAALAETAAEAVLALADYADELAPVAAGRVLCVSGRGPLDRAAAAMVGQALERRGLRVREAARLPESGSPELQDVAAVLVCGLFDARAAHRIGLVLAPLRDTATPILIGVSRTAEAEETGDVAASITALCDATVALLPVHAAPMLRSMAAEDQGSRALGKPAQAAS